MERGIVGSRTAQIFVWLLGILVGLVVVMVWDGDDSGEEIGFAYLLN